MWVVKLGGSLHDVPDLRAWLAWAAQRGGSTVLVPGGGPFADAVRALQPGLGYDDHAAHGMAILAMQQYALHLHGLEPRLRLGESEAELRAGGPCLWLPWRLAGRAAELPASWDLTSDSVALWLATRLAAPQLVLVKAGRVPAGPCTAAELAATGLIDPAFPALAARYAGAIHVVRHDRLPLDLGHACQVLPASSTSSASASAAATTSWAVR